MNYQEALQIAHAYKNKMALVSLCMSRVIPTKHGWWFEFQTTEYMETANPTACAGDDANYPLFISKSGDIWNVVGPYSPSRFFEEYESYIAGGGSQWLKTLAPWCHKAIDYASS